MKWCWTLVLGKWKWKPLWNHCTPVRMTNIKIIIIIIKIKLENIKCWWGYKVTEFSYTGGKRKRFCHFGKEFAVSYKIKYTFTKHNPAMLFLGIHSNEMKSFIYSKTYVHISMRALSVIIKTWKQSKCPSTGEWISKLVYIHRVEFYSATRRNTLLIQSTTRWISNAPC